MRQFANVRATLNLVAPLLTEPVDEGRITCASAILIHNDRVIFKEAVGLADMENNIPFTVDTICHVGSTTKWISGATLMALVDEGKISLDDPAGADPGTAPRQSIRDAYESK